MGEVDFGHLAPPKHTIFNANSRENIDPHSIFTSLKSSETNDNSNNLGDVQTAYTESHPRSNPFIAEEINSGRQIEGLPGPPQDLKAPIVKARFVVLSWKPPILNSDDIITYSVYYRQEGSKR